MKISEKTMKILEREQKCTGCKACMKGCPMLHEFCKSPDSLLRELLEKREYDYNLTYSCMLCGYCTKVCQFGVDLKALFLELRRDAVNETKGRLPRKLKTNTVDFHQKFSFSNIFTTDIQGPSSNVIFFPGCSLIAYSPEMVYAIYKYLNERLKGIGYYNKCCGKPTVFMGKEDKFKEYYSLLEKEFNSRGVKKIITACQNCYMTLGENSPDIEVVSLWEVLAEIGVPRANIDCDISFTIHDPCPTRNVDSIHASVREIMEELGLRYNEMRLNRGETLCCGSGGMVSTTQNHISRKHMERRANESSGEYIITYCQECVESMRRGGKKAFHILDLLFNEDFKGMKQENQGTLKKWLNRYRGKKLR